MTLNRRIFVLFCALALCIGCGTSRPRPSFSHKEVQIAFTQGAYDRALSMAHALSLHMHSEYSSWQALRYDFIFLTYLSMLPPEAQAVREKYAPAALRLLDKSLPAARTQSKRVDLGRRTAAGNLRAADEHWSAVAAADAPLAKLYFHLGDDAKAAQHLRSFEANARDPRSVWERFCHAAIIAAHLYEELDELVDMVRMLRMAQRGQCIYSPGHSAPGELPVDVFADALMLTTRNGLLKEASRIANVRDIALADSAADIRVGFSAFHEESKIRSVYASWMVAGYSEIAQSVLYFMEYVSDE